jgi:hypothetical protein
MKWISRLSASGRVARVYALSARYARAGDRGETSLSDEPDVWEAWALGRYFIGGFTAVLLGIGPLIEGYWFGVVPLVAGLAFIVLTNHRRRRADARSDHQT